MVAESANPSNTQLGNRDAFTIRHIRQTFHELQIVTDILIVECVSLGEWSGASVKYEAHVILETA